MRLFSFATGGVPSSLSGLAAAAALAGCLLGSAPAWSACQTTTQVVPPGATFTNTGCISTTNVNAVNAGPASTVINSPTGSITLTTNDLLTSAVNASGNSNVLTNNGAINVVSSNLSGNGMSLSGLISSSNLLTNNGTITLQGGLNAMQDGIFGSSNTAINNGTIDASSMGGFGISLSNANDVGINNGSILLSGNAFGLFSASGLATNNVTLTNNGSISYASGSNGAAMECTVGCNLTNSASGTITLGANTSAGMFIAASGTVTNAGSIIVTGTDSSAINTNGDSNSVTTRGSIQVSGANSFGIQVNDANNTAFTPGTVTTITNSGSVNVTGQGSYGVAFATPFLLFFTPSPSTGNTFFNTGTVQAGPNAIAVGDIAQKGVSPTLNSVFNSGTIDGQISLSQGTHESLTNSGLITISYPGAGIVHSINGTFTQTASGTLAVRVDANGNNDKMAVNGAANVNGTVAVLAQAGNYGSSTKYTSVTASAGVTGTFANVTSNMAFLTPTLSYDPNDVFLTLTRNTTFFSSIALTRNERAVAAALDASPFASPLVQAVLFQSKAGALQAFDALSGEIHASVQTALIDDSGYMRQAVLGRLRSAGYAGATGGMVPLAFGGPDMTVSAADGAFDRVDHASMAYGPMVTKAPVLKAPAAYDSDLTFWAQGVGTWGRWNSDGNAATMDRTLGGAFVGVDRRFADTWRLGLAAGYTQSDLKVDARASSADIETFHVAGYAGTMLGPLSVRAGVAGAWHDIDTSRSIIFPGFLETAQAKYHGSTAQAFGEVGYGMAFGTVAVEPFAGAAWVHVETNGFTETGSLGGVAPLAGAGNQEDVGYTQLGVRAATSFALPNGAFVIPRLTVAWQHAFDDITPTAALAFQSTGIPFTIAGVPLARDAAVVDAGFDVKVAPGATLGISYAGQLADNVQDHAVKGKFSWKF